MITTDLNRAEFTGDGSSTVFVFRQTSPSQVNIPVTDSSHIKVYVASVLKTLTTHYSVAIVDKVATITFVSPAHIPANSAEILFIREVPFKQETDLANNSQLEAESLESQLDLIVNQSQQLNDRISRNLRLSDTLTEANATEAQATLNKTSALRANKSLKFDAQGALTTSLLDVDDFQTHIDAAAAEVVLAEAQVALAVAQVGLAEDEKDDAVTAKEAAEDAQAAAELLLDNFDDRYLGTKSADPTVDNDNQTLVDGAIYYNTTSDYIKVYDSSLTPKWRQITPTITSQANIDALALGTDGTANAGGTNLNIAQINTVALKINDVSNYADQYQISNFDPVPDKDGGGVNALSKGDMAFDTILNALRVWNGSAWSSGVDTTDGVIVKHEYTANGSNTHFALAHDQGMEIVYLNGVKILSGDGSNNNDYFSVSGGSSTTYVGDGNAATHIYFHSAPANTHLVSLIAWGASANTLAVPISGGTFSGAVTCAAGLVANTADINGGTIDGATITSPVINTAVSGSAILDEDAMGSNSATKLATQQSIKAYVDSQAYANYTDDGWKYITSTGKDLSAAGSAPDYWHTLDFDREQFKGGNVAESAGVFTLSTPGVYAISILIAPSDTTVSTYGQLFHNDVSASTIIRYEPAIFSRLTTSNVYQTDISTTYYVNIEANDTVYFKGKGHFDGNWCGSGSISCSIHGCRIG